MLFFYLILFVFIIIGIKPTRFNDDYLSIKTVKTINGIFVLLVFARHISQYVQFSDFFLDTSFVWLDSFMGQLIVAPFFFYSGYGIMYSLMNKDSYAKHFFKKRILPLYLQFFFIVSLFLIISLCVDGVNSLTIPKVLLSFIGWESLGNSNWYIFVVFMLYFGVLFSFLFLKKNHYWIGLIIFTFLSFCLVLFLRITKEPHWWNTLLCFSAGMWFSYFKERIDFQLKQTKKYWLFFIVIFILFASLLVAYKYLSWNILFIPLSISFSCFIVMLSVKFAFNSAVLAFFGSHVFSFYMLQRIPMKLFQNIISQPYFLFLVCFAITVIASVVFDLLFNKLKGTLNK